MFRRLVPTLRRSRGLDDTPIRLYQNFVKAIYSKRLRFSVAVHLILRRNVDTVKPLLIHLPVRCYYFQINLSDKLKKKIARLPLFIRWRYRFARMRHRRITQSPRKFELGQFNVAYTKTFEDQGTTPSWPTSLVNDFIFRIWSNH